MDALEQLLLEIGLNLNPVKEAAKVVAATMGDLNKITDQYQAKSAAAGDAQLTKTKSLAQAAVAGATAALAEEKKRQAALEAQTAELAKQVAQQKESITILTAGLAAEEKKLSLLKAETEQRKAELVEIKKQHEEEERGHHKREERGEGGFFQRVGTAALRRGGLTRLAGEVAGGVVGGELTSQLIEQVVDKLREVTKEAGSISLLDAQFRRLATGAGVDADKMLANMSEHTEGLIDRFHLLQAASAGLKSHMFTPAEIAEGAGAVVRVAEAQGMSAEAGLQAYIRALETGRGVGLAKQVGIPTQLARPQVQPLPTGMAPFERQRAEFRSQMKIIDEYNAKLGEMPVTFEQMEKRIRNAIKDLSLAFGQGLNESPGAQVFLNMMGEGAKTLEGLYPKLVELGKRAGDAFGVIAVAAKGAMPAVEALWDIFKNLTAIVGELLGGIITSLPGKADEATQKFQAMHPVLSDIVNTVIDFETGLAKILIYLDVGLEKLKGWKKGVEDVVPKPVRTALALAQGMYKMAFPWSRAESEAGGTAGPSLDERLKNADEAAKRLKETFAKQYTEAEEASKKIPSGLSLGQPSAENIAMEKKLAQEEMQLRIVLAKQRLEYRKEEIQEEKALDERAYREGEETLEQHIANQTKIAKENLRAQRQLAKDDYDAKMADAKVNFDTVKKQFAAIGMPVSAEAQKVEALREQKIYNDYVNQWLVAGRQFDIEKTRIQKEGDDDRSAAAIKNIQDNLAAEKEAIGVRQQLLEKSLGRREIDPDTYYRRKIDMIHEAAIAEIAVAQMVYDNSAKNQKNLTELQDKQNKAEQHAQEQIDELVDGRIQREIAYINALYGAAEGRVGAAAEVAAAQGNVPRQRGLLQQQMGLYGQQRAALEAQLPGAVGTKEWNDLQEQISKLDMTMIQLAEAIQKLATPMTDLGAVLGSIGGGIGSVFHSKFAQNLASSVSAGAKSITAAPGLAKQIAGQTYNATTQQWEDIKDPMTKFTGQITASVQALSTFIETLTSARNAISGGIGGATAGAGLAGAVGGGLAKLTGVAALGGPLGQLGGAVIGGAIGMITGGKNQQVINQINNLNISFKQIMLQFSENTNNLQVTIQQIEGLLEEARTMQASSKKGSAQYQQVINQYIDQLNQLHVQQQQTMRDLQQQLAILQEPQGAQQYLSDLKGILDQYEKFAGAASSTQDLANATQFLVESLQNYETTLGTQLLQDNQQAIQDAIQLNDLLWQRNQMTIEYNQQVSQILSQGVLTRQLTRAQTAGTQIYLLTQQYERQKEQIDEQVSATQYRVNAEQQIFDLATTRVGLETQLLGLQNQQTNLDMLRIAALATLVNQLQTGQLSAGALGALIQSIQQATTGAAGGGPTTTTTQLPGLPGFLGQLAQQAQGSNPQYTAPTSNTDIVAQLETLFAQAYQNRASMGFGSYRAGNL